MKDQTETLESLELAERDMPFCEACGAPTVVMARDDQLWLECATLGGESALLSALRVLGAGHARQLIIGTAA